MEQRSDIQQGGNIDITDRGEADSQTREHPPADSLIVDSKALLFLDQRREIPNDMKL